MAAKTDDASKAVLPRGFLQASLLLLLSESPSHGYDLYARVAAMGLRLADAGVVYRALHDMEARNLVVSTPERGARRPQKRTYAATAAGRDHLRRVAEEIRAGEEFLSAYESRVDQVTPGRRHHAAA